MRVAVARSLSIGGFELRNVAFLVAHDGQQPFKDLPTAWGGVLGIPVIVAFETIRWADGRFEAAFNAPSSRFREPTMCFDGANPLVHALYAGRPVYVFLDTGATISRAMPLFAKEFPEIMATATKGAVTVRGVGGSIEVDSAILSVLAFQIGGSKGVLKPAEVLLKNPEGKDDRFHIWPGLDLFPKPRRVTIDFRSMTFELE
jgi:hypothetical protein